MNDLGSVADRHRPQLSAQQRALGHDGTGAGDFTFGDFLDIINPLQHIPIVSNIYRAITGDEIRPHARILGDTLFGGPMGFLSAVANVFYEEVAGEDVGETVLAFFTGEDGEDAVPQFAGAGAEIALETAAGRTIPAAAPAPTAHDQGAVLPEAAPGMLTGQAALDALFLDLSRGRQGALPLPVPAPDNDAARPDPLPSRGTPGPVPAAPEAGPAAHPLLFAQEVAGGALADRMMQALEKYEAMARQGATRQREADEHRQDGRVLWQADPTGAL